ncbi:hypothetical protein J5N97_029984 [Dioscorea zingiberensis]|uniref:Uncharacterized protein n=1 Tax=Dioscorea zingiberensis TaxID=325984 RepID=A0A9D5BX46_9LILI|nr:hypothetical protein J5N97_029984 [Dioscorea zingiberensis]
MLELIIVVLHKNKKKYKINRKEGCEHYSVLVEMFNRTLASSLMGHSSTQTPPDSNEDRQMEEDFLHGHSQAQGALSKTNGDGDHFNGPFEAGASSDRRRRKSPFERRSKPCKMDRMDLLVDQWISSNESRCEESSFHKKYFEGILAKLAKGSEKQDDPFFVDVCMEILNGMEGLTDDMYSKFSQSMQDPITRNMFIKVPAEERLAWLKNLS